MGETIHRFGRYVLLDWLGSGGGGQVYAAYDPELDRKVAIKLMLGNAPGRPSNLRAQLLREAQALA
jgi:serine/threonine protein kinase